LGGGKKKLSEAKIQGEGGPSEDDEINNKWKKGRKCKRKKLVFAARKKRKGVMGGRKG